MQTTSKLQGQNKTCKNTKRKLNGLIRGMPFINSNIKHNKCRSYPSIYYTKMFPNKSLKSAVYPPSSVRFCFTSLKPLFSPVQSNFLHKYFVFLITQHYQLYKTIHFFVQEYKLDQKQKFIFIQAMSAEKNVRQVELGRALRVTPGS